MSTQALGKLYLVARKLDSADVSICALLNQASRLIPLRNLFRIVSRLGDGVVWYCIMAMLPVIGGYDGVIIALHMVFTALAGLLIYKIIKTLSSRERPYVQHSQQVACAMPPLDRYSFPSGHTLHAVSFTIVLYAYFPQMLWILLPLSLLIALSRMVLGLHYPSDVLAGAAIGTALSLGSIGIMDIIGFAVY
jgi:undecaprenyl-diphosphatase